MEKVKYKQIYNELRRAITSGEYKEGQQLPSEAELVKRFATSRPTVARALRDLQHQELIVRRVGSGSYVRKAASVRNHIFGLLIPNLGETEIFEPICREMYSSAEAGHHALLWGMTTDEATREKKTEQLCEQYINRKVSGIFFAPLEWTPENNRVNQYVAEALDSTGIPVVLLDRDLYEYPRRSHFDLVGIDNRRAGFIVTEHMLQLGCRRIGFVVRPYSAETVESRIAGFHDALSSYGVTLDSERVCRGEPSDPSFVKQALEQTGAEAFVCANDATAANLMHTLDGLGVKIPDEVRIVGIDDLKYAKLLRVPLTTLHQPCQHIGAAAIRAMLERIANPNMPARDIRLDCRLVVRESCGAGLGRNVELDHSAPALS